MLGMQVFFTCPMTLFVKTQLFLATLLYIKYREAAKNKMSVPLRPPPPP